jgi:hypothetical protein
MKPAHYSVIKYIADPARGEALNIGIIVWDENGFRLRVDGEAAARVIRDHPWLARDALHAVAPHLLERIESAAEVSETPADAVRTIIERQKGYPILLSDPRETTILTDKGQGLEDTLDRLVARLATPRRRGGGGGPTPFQLVERELRPLIRRHVVQPHWTYHGSHSGVPRTVDFYANSMAHVALDTARLAITSADEVLLRADAEAHKIEDILTGAKGAIHFIVYLALSNQDEILDANQRALRVLSALSPKVDILTDPVAAADRMKELIG